jgi:hypothetical protein
MNENRLGLSDSAERGIIASVGYWSLDFSLVRIMKPLHEITSFPAARRQVLERQFGIASAEAFFEHATRNAEGVQAALDLTAPQLAELLRLVEGYLPTAFVQRCRQPASRHSRGVIVD